MGINNVSWDIKYVILEYMVLLISQKLIVDYVLPTVQEVFVRSILTCIKTINVISKQPM